MLLQARGKCPLLLTSRALCRQGALRQSAEPQACVSSDQQMGSITGARVQAMFQQPCSTPQHRKHFRPTHATHHGRLMCDVHVPRRTPILSGHPQPRSRSQFALAALSGSPEWTLDQIAGLFIGVLLAATFFFARKIDELVARSQRRELGLCELCGGLNDASQCTEAKCPLRQ